jgi:nucleoside-diphosphate-sugar epimerase
MNGQEKAVLKAPLVIVTGAAGWLGRRVVRALAGKLEDGAGVDLAVGKIRCLVPAGEETRDLLACNAEIVTGDLRDADARKALLADSAGAIVLHLAGVIHPQRVAEFDAINHRAAKALAEDSRRAGVRRFVAMSSNSPIGVNARPDDRFDETSPYHPYMGYGRSKMLMELALRDMIGRPDAPEITIVRAPWFYGPGQPPRQTLFFTMIRDGKFPLVGDGNNRRSMAYIDDLARGTLLATASKAGANEIFWIADENPYAMRDIIATVRDVLRDDFGRKVMDRTPQFPAIVGTIAETADRLLQGFGVYQQKIHVLSEMNKTIACDIGKARRVLGYSPKVGLREGMRRSIAWCIETGQRI